MFVNCEIDWFVTTSGNAVQVALSGNSPVAFSQIVALAVDNGRCGTDVQFVFPDSGFTLQVPAFNQGVYPVFTNALMFYVVALGSAAPGDQTSFQILNSMPPPVAIQPASEQAIADINSFSLSANGTTQLIPAGVSGTIEAMNLIYSTNQGATVGAVGLLIRDGSSPPVTLWQSELAGPANTVTTIPISVAPVRLRFINGLQAVVSGTSLAAGAFMSANIYYGNP